MTCARRRRSRAFTVWVGQGWTRLAALNRGKKLLPKGFDYRGFSYDPADGYAVFK